MHQKVYQALNPKGWNSNPYYSIWEIYPEEHKILAYDIERESEDDYLVVNYTVDEDTVVLGEIKNTKLSTLIAEKTNVNISVDLNEAAKLIADKETTNKELNESIKELTSEVESKTEALVEAASKITELESEVSELKPYKEKWKPLNLNSVKQKQLVKKKNSRPLHQQAITSLAKRLKLQN